jgi:hypothetical protein
MGSPTIVADVLSPGPTSQLAARLLDVDPASGMETLVARGLYRPEINTSATRQVFQLHPNAYRFAPGHVAKLELLPADQPYGRNSNGQAAVTVSNLELRLPVLEPAGCGLIQEPAEKIVPPGYTLAADFADTGFHCAACALSGCTTGPSRLLIKNKTPDSRDTLLWKMKPAATTSVGDFGNPPVTTSYALCIYDGNGALLVDATAPNDGICRGKLCWTSSAHGYRYSDRDLTPDGVQKVQLKAGAPGAAKIVVVGKGANLSLPPLPVGTLPVTVQFAGSHGKCWQASYPTAQKNQSDQLKAKSN